MNCEVESTNHFYFSTSSRFDFDAGWQNEFRSWQRDLIDWKISDLALETED
jgi:hypothetical protein